VSRKERHGEKHDPQSSMTDQTVTTSSRLQARICGLLYLILIVAGAMVLHLIDSVRLLIYPKVTLPFEKWQEQARAAWAGR
jgi:hypothetical protein